MSICTKQTGYSLCDDNIIFKYTHSGQVIHFSTQISHSILKEQAQKEFNVKVMWAKLS